MLDNKGNMYVEEDDIVELMLQNRQAKILPRNTETFRIFDATCKTYGVKNPFVQVKPLENTLDWCLPEPWASIDIAKHLQTLVPGSDVARWNRINMELSEFEQRDLLDLLRFLMYLVHTMRTNNIVYGVGRGSSVASYVLYLIGIHRIDSFKYNMDIKEFLK